MQRIGTIGRMMTTTDIAWPALTTPELRLESGKRRRHYWIDVVLGLGLAGAGAAVVCFAAMALLTSNSCGMFADGCDTYGQPAPGFELFVLATLLSLVAVAAFFLALIGRAIFHSGDAVAEPRVDGLELGASEAYRPHRQRSTPATTKPNAPAGQPLPSDHP
jgi:hypothetical protein